MNLSRKFDEFCTHDVPRQVARVPHLDDRIGRSMQYESGHVGG